MLDIRFVRENPEIVKENIRKKFQNAKLPLVDEAIALDAAIADELYHHPNPTKDKRIHMPTEKRVREPVSQEDLARIMNHLPNMLPEHTSLLAMLIMTGGSSWRSTGSTMGRH